MSNYPDTMSGSDYCHTEGCIGRGRCPRCGDINYALMGYYGALATWAKRWGVSEEEAEKRFYANEPCSYVHESGDRCVLPEHEGPEHDLGYAE